MTSVAFIPSLGKCSAAGTVNIRRPRICISKKLCGVPVAAKSFNHGKEATFRSISMVTAATGLQSPISVPNNGTVKESVAEAPIISEGTDVIFKSELSLSGTNLEIKVIGGTSRSKVTFKGVDYILDQLHVHTPSENTLDTRSLAMEMHLVHYDKDGNPLVLAMWIEKGSENTEFWKVLDAFQEEGTETTVNVQKMLGAGIQYPQQFLTYEGSFTTPDESGVYREGVWWIVSKEIIHVRWDQVEKYQKSPHVKTPNNRSTQDPADRAVTAYIQ